MKRTSPIRVIKREERGRKGPGGQEASVKKVKETPEASLRELQATISSWVREFQQRRREKPRPFALT